MCHAPTLVHLKAALSTWRVGGREPRARNFVGFRVISHMLMQWLGDQAWRPFRGVVGRLCSLAEPAMVSLALDGAHLPTEGEGWWAGLGFRV